MIPDLKGILNRYPRLKQTARRMAATIPLHVRLGKNFWEWYAFFEESQHWTEDELHDFQLDRIKLLLTELVRTSPFYRERFSTFDVGRLASLKEFCAKIPPITRREFRENYPHLLSTEWQAQHPVRFNTSGTTGMALQFYHAAEDDSRRWAAVCHQWKRVGYEPSKSRRAVFRGLTTSNKLIDVYPEQNMLRCSILHMKPDHIRFYAETIRKYRVGFYHGYPSALYSLSKVINDAGIDFPQPRAILLVSEMVYDWQLEQIRKIFPAAKLFSHYGCTERTVMASWCEYRDEYHVLPQYAFVEVDSNTSEIIGTNLYNTINGFVRYRMTDMALETRGESCPNCCRPYVPRLSKLGGRMGDYLYSSQNGWISPAILTYPIKGLIAIQETQLWQRARDRVTIRYSVRSGSDVFQLENDLRHVKEGMCHLLGKDMVIQLEPVEDFTRSASGKFKWIVSEIEGPHSQ